MSENAGKLVTILDRAAQDRGAGLVAGAVAFQLVAARLGRAQGVIGRQAQRRAFVDGEFVGRFLAARDGARYGIAAAQADGGHENQKNTRRFYSLPFHVQRFMTRLRCGARGVRASRAASGPHRRPTIYDDLSW